VSRGHGPRVECEVSEEAVTGCWGMVCWWERWVFVSLVYLEWQKQRVEEFGV
jgi:hypothetical protein